MAEGNVLVGVLEVCCVLFRCILGSARTVSKGPFAVKAFLYAPESPQLVYSVFTALPRSPICAWIPERSALNSVLTVLMALPLPFPVFLFLRRQRAIAVAADAWGFLIGRSFPSGALGLTAETGGFPAGKPILSTFVLVGVFEPLRTLSNVAVELLVLLAQKANKHVEDVGGIARFPLRPFEARRGIQIKTAHIACDFIRYGDGLSDSFEVNAHLAVRHVFSWEAVS